MEGQFRWNSLRLTQLEKRDWKYGLLKEKSTRIDHQKRYLCCEFVVNRRTF